MSKYIKNLNIKNIEIVKFIIGETKNIFFSINMDNERIVAVFVKVFTCSDILLAQLSLIKNV